MWVSQLQLTNFRNYARLQLQPDAGLCVLTGDNAAGKTNVLEAVFLCALGRSHRTSRDAELIRESEQAGAVALTLHTRGGTRSISCKLMAGERKRVLIDGTALSRSGELLGCLNVVMFAPEDLMLVKGGPGERRRFLDMEISQLRPAYYYTLQQYNVALKQRNALLKAEAETALLEPWDEQLSRLGAAITAERAQFLSELGGIASRLHVQLSGGRETLLLAYQPNLPDAEPDRLAAAMRERLFDALERDRFRGSTSVGPHRDDVAMALDGSDVRVYGSQGQQRTVVLSLKLSELQIMRQLRGESPVLLLDDVFSELDRRRQRTLLDAVQGCQTFLTCTHLEELSAAGALQMQVYSVSAGNVIEV